MVDPVVKPINTEEQLLGMFGWMSFLPPRVPAFPPQQDRDPKRSPGPRGWSFDGSFWVPASQQVLSFRGG